MAGRPRKFSQEYLNMLKPIYPEVTTERGILDIAYRQHAFNVLMDSTSENIQFLHNREKGPLNVGVLRELGKIENDDMILTIARYICQRAKTEKHTVRQWAAFVKYCQYCLETERSEFQKVRYLIEHDLQGFAISETVS